MVLGADQGLWGLSKELMFLGLVMWGRGSAACIQGCVQRCDGRPVVDPSRQQNIPGLNAAFIRHAPLPQNSIKLLLPGPMAASDTVHWKFLQYFGMHFASTLVELQIASHMPQRQNCRKSKRYAKPGLKAPRACCNFQAEAYANSIAIAPDFLVQSVILLMRASGPHDVHATNSGGAVAIYYWPKRSLILPNGHGSGTCVEALQYTGFLEPCWAGAKCHDQLQSLMAPLWLHRVCLAMLCDGCHIAMDPHQPACLAHAMAIWVPAFPSLLTKPMVIRADRLPKAPHTL